VCKKTPERAFFGEKAWQFQENDVPLQPQTTEEACCLAF
jgi:hypothetical protein